MQHVQKLRGWQFFQKIGDVLKLSAGVASARVNPPKTGTYTVIFSVSSKRAKSLYWALAYGYH